MPDKVLSLRDDGGVEAKPYGPSPTRVFRQPNQPTPEVGEAVLWIKSDDNPPTLWDVVNNP